MQGYVEIEPCVIEEQSFEFTLISRRSRDRSGLRYQRRGIDEHGNTANFVETEQLLRIVVCLFIYHIWPLLPHTNVMNNGLAIDMGLFSV